MDSANNNASNKEKKENQSKQATITGKDETKIPVRGEQKSKTKKGPGTTKANSSPKSKPVKKTTKASPGAIQKKRGRPKKVELNGISDIRRAFHKNEEPLYFISATNFNLLGADEWIKGFRFITYIECFDGQHPNVFSPKNEIPHDDFEGIEDASLSFGRTKVLY